MPTIKTKKEKTPRTTKPSNIALQNARREKLETMDAIRNVKNEIFEKSKAQLPELVKEKVDKIVEEITTISKEIEEAQVFEQTKYGQKLDYIDYGLTEARIAPILASRTANFFVSATYSADELYIIYQEFIRMIAEINKKIKYLPTKKKFCMFAGISTETYNTYLQSPDEDKRNVVRAIDDYISDTNLSSAQKGDIREITTIFRSKAEHGMVEASAPIVIEHKTEINLEEMRRKVEGIKNKKIINAEFTEKE